MATQSKKSASIEQIYTLLLQMSYLDGELAEQLKVLLPTMSDEHLNVFLVLLQKQKAAQDTAEKNQIKNTMGILSPFLKQIDTMRHGVAKLKRRREDRETAASNLAAERLLPAL